MKTWRAVLPRNAAGLRRCCPVSQSLSGFAPTPLSPLTEMVDGKISRFVWLRQLESGGNSAGASRLLDRLDCCRHWQCRLEFWKIFRPMGSRACAARVRDTLPTGCAKSLVIGVCNVTPRKEFVDACDFMVGDLGKDPSELGLWIEFIERGSFGPLLYLRLQSPVWHCVDVEPAVCRGFPARGLFHFVEKRDAPDGLFANLQQRPVDGRAEQMSHLGWLQS